MSGSEIAGGFAELRVLVAGDVMLDEFLFGEVRRISPEAPVPVVELRRQSDVPGGAANAAANLASLGCEALLAGVAGADDAGSRLAAALRARGVRPGGLVTDPSRPTTTKTRVIAHGQQVARVDREDSSPVGADVERRLLGFATENLPSCRACVLSDYGKGAVTEGLARRLIGRAAEARVPVVVDPKGGDPLRYAGATLVKPNLQEAGELLRRGIDSEGALLDAGRELLGLLGGAAVLVTRGAQGMTLFVRGHDPAHIPALAREVFDVTGAGDTVAATLAACLASGADLLSAARLAARAAAAVVGRVGTACALPGDLAGGGP